MKWSRLLSPKRERTGRKHKEKNRTDLRTSFEKDYHRIIGSASFRRLQDKTQVFPLDQSDFVRTRLTHSLEVSSFAKSLGQNIGEYILAYGKDPEFTPQMKEDICNIFALVQGSSMILGIHRLGISERRRSGNGLRNIWITSSFKGNH